MQSVDPDGSSLVVLGQFVAVNQKTVIDESIPGRVDTQPREPGRRRHKVSGLVAGDGNIVATLIMKRTGILHHEVEGIIKNHDAGGKRFEIGQLVVEYSSAEVDDIAAGDTIELEQPSCPCARRGSCNRAAKCRTALRSGPRE